MSAVTVAPTPGVGQRLGDEEVRRRLDWGRQAGQGPVDIDPHGRP
jgi:hypothetical protein